MNNFIRKMMENDLQIGDFPLPCFFPKECIENISFETFLPSSTDKWPHHAGRARMCLKHIAQIGEGHSRVVKEFVVDDMK